MEVSHASEQVLRESSPVHGLSSVTCSLNIPYLNEFSIQLQSFHCLSASLLDARRMLFGLVCRSDHLSGLG